MRYESECYRARSLTGSCWLSAQALTVEDMRKEIDLANKRTVERGFSPSRWQITHMESHRVCDDDGVFIERSETEKAIEIYPEEV